MRGGCVGIAGRVKASGAVGLWGWGGHHLAATPSPLGSSSTREAGGQGVRWHSGENAGVWDCGAGAGAGAGEVITAGFWDCGKACDEEGEGNVGRGA